MMPPRSLLTILLVVLLLLFSLLQHFSAVNSTSPFNDPLTIKQQYQFDTRELDQQSSSPSSPESSLIVHRTINSTHEQTITFFTFHHSSDDDALGDSLYYVQHLSLTTSMETIVRSDPVIHRIKPINYLNKMDEKNDENDADSEPKIEICQFVGVIQNVLYLSARQLSSSPTTTFCTLWHVKIPKMEQMMSEWHDEEEVVMMLERVNRNVTTTTSDDNDGDGGDHVQNYEVEHVSSYRYYSDRNKVKHLIYYDDVDQGESDDENRYGGSLIMAVSNEKSSSSSSSSTKKQKQIRHLLVIQSSSKKKGSQEEAGDDENDENHSIMLIPDATGRIQGVEQIVFPVRQDEKEPLGILVQYKPDKMIEPTPNLIFYKLVDDKLKAVEENVFNSGGGSLLDKLNQVYLFLVQRDTQLSTLVTMPRTIVRDPDGSLRKEQNLPVVIDLPFGQKLDSKRSKFSPRLYERASGSGSAPSDETLFLIFEMFDKEQPDRKQLYRTNGKRIQLLSTYDVLNLDQPRAVQTMESLSDLYVLLDNKVQILMYESSSPASILQPKLELPVFAQVEPSMTNGIRLLKVIGNSLLVEYCVTANNCVLGYFSRGTRLLSTIPFDSTATRVKKISILDDSPNANPSIAHLSMTYADSKTQIIRVQFNTDKSTCFPPCVNGFCSDSGVCLCDNTPSKGFWTTDANGSCTKCAKRYEGSTCQTPKKQYTCYGVKSTLDSVCSGHGECTGDNKCECDADYENGFWAGAQCDKCLNNFDKALGCRACKFGWQGERCETKIKSSGSYCFGIPSTSDKVCSGHGKCQQNGDCVCSRNSDQGYWDGAQCQHCLNHFDYGKGCKTCQKGYEGELCDRRKNITVYNCFGIDSDEDAVCGGHGLCVSNNTCVCDKRYSGDRCQHTSCFGLSSTSDEVCSGSQGSCVQFNECKCKEGYTGYDCRVWDEGNSPWITIIVMSALSAISVFVMLGMVGYFKWSRGKVHYSRLSNFQNLFSDDEDDDEDDDFASDLFMSADENEPEFNLRSRPSNASPAARMVVDEPPQQLQQDVREEIEEDNQQQQQDDDNHQAQNTRQSSSLIVLNEDSDEEDKL